MRAKMELKSEQEKREGGEKTHCIICAENFEEDWIQCRICGGWAHENCDDLGGNNLFYAPFQNFRTIPGRRRLTSYLYFNVQQAHIHGGSSVESDFEHGTLQARSRDLATRPPRP
ncbi:hypothetical protein AVEN_235946-1 [Araneus ventricosus]|uniref:Uncharacterized protein n=1 Tax=Araneus ventricosus TaxID=182803 RepID=A0A4Y2NTW9_ARAVE|nr:hypothetical protein AVEN_235946-1 [Araneus ventricosus]